LDKVTKDLVQRLLVPDPNIRLEMREVKAHKFFKTVDWGKTANKQIPVPFVPSVPDDNCDPVPMLFKSDWEEHDLFKDF
jgi:serine/threonine protein kinase